MKKFGRMIFVLAFMMGLLAAMTAVAEAEDVYYTGSDDSISATKVTGDNIEWVENEEGSWYAVTEDTVIDGTVTVKGTVNLILYDGAELKVSDGIVNKQDTQDGITLNIYAGSTLPDNIKGGGTLTVNRTAAGHGIDIRNLCIYGGSVNATGSDIKLDSSEYQNGINSQNLNIYGGSVNATGGTSSSGILGARITIYDGAVTAKGGSDGAGILGENQGATITINGGTVMAIGGDGSHSGIGCPSDNSTISISGGIVEAISGTGGSSISSSRKESEISISGGTVKAISRNTEGFGIEGNKTTISGSNTTVYANCSEENGQVTAINKINVNEKSYDVMGRGIHVEDITIKDATVYAYGVGAILNVNDNSFFSNNCGILGSVKASGKARITAIGANGRDGRGLTPKIIGRIPENGSAGIEGSLTVESGSPTITATGGEGYKSSDSYQGIGGDGIIGKVTVTDGSPLILASGGAGKRPSAEDSASGETIAPSRGIRGTIDPGSINVLVSEKSSEGPWSKITPFPSAGVEAQFVKIEPKQIYSVTVLYGDGSGQYEKGEEVKIKANAASNRMAFVGWTSEDDVDFKDAAKEETSFIMPEKPVKVEAKYLYIPTGNVTVSIPLKDGESGNTIINITGTISGSTVNLNTISEDIFNKAARTNGSVIIDVSGLKKDIKEIRFNATTVKNLKNSIVKNLEIILTDGSITLDRKAIDTLEAASAGADSLKVHIEKVKVSALTRTQQEALKDIDSPIIFDVTLTRGNVEVHNLDGGKVTIKARYESSEGKTPDLFYLTEAGVLERVGNVEYIDGFLIWTGDHCSIYVVKEISIDSGIVNKMIDSFGANPDPEKVAEARAAYEALREKKAEIDGSVVKALEAAEHKVALDEAEEIIKASENYKADAAVKVAREELEKAIKGGKTGEIIKATETLESAVKAAEDAEKARKAEEEKARKAAEEKAAADKKAAQEKAAKEAKELADATSAARTALKAAEAYSNNPSVKTAIDTLNAAIREGNTEKIKAATTALNEAVKTASTPKAASVKISTKSKTFKASALKKKAGTFKIKYKKTKGSGKAVFTKMGGSKKLTVSKAGKVKIKKGTGKGIYKIKVKVTVAANKTYKAGTASRTIKVKVKN